MARDDRCPICSPLREPGAPEWTTEHLHDVHPGVVAACRRSRPREDPIPPVRGQGQPEKPSPGYVPTARTGGRRAYAPPAP